MNAASQTSAPVLAADARKRADRTTATALIIGGAACLSASAVFVKLADVNAGTAAFLRCAIALVPLIPMLVHETRRHGGMSRSLNRYAVTAGVFLGADYVMWTLSILDIGAAVATVLINVQVIVFPLLARVLDGTAVPRRFLWSCPLMLAGIALAGGVLNSGAHHGHPVRGTVLGIGAGSAYAVYLYLTRRCGRSSPCHVVSPVCVSTAAAAVASGVISLLTTGLPLAIPAASWGWIVALALLGQVAAWLLISKGGPMLPPNTSAALLLLQPVMAIGFALVILHETPTYAQLSGCALVICAVWINNRSPRAVRA
ncbi:DMT family transporter [Streptomyces orinoci]|uniref:DMT family transporter n=1 Tax=Streptomyces orinoci TaxID=67339 RepID=A0ABV3K599_STRON|nr:DMT family transporter [Streptomyces orinoci]